MLVTKKVSGVCAREIRVAVSDGIIMGVELIGGCDGQNKVLNAMLCGKTPYFAAKKLKGITCGKRQTSCANELAMLLEEAQ